METNKTNLLEQIEKGLKSLLGEKYVLNGSLIVFFCIIFYLHVIFPKIRNNNLSQHEIVHGKFLSFRVSKIGVNRSAKIEFTHKGKRRVHSAGYNGYVCRNSETEDLEKRKELLSWRFPVAVSTIDENYFLPLIRPEDFEVINLTFPDSMHYMYNKYFDCTLLEYINAGD